MAQKIDSLLDVGKISGEIELIAKKMSDEFGKATNLSTFTAGGVGVGNTKEFDAMKKAVEELVAARKKLTIAEQYDYQEVVRLQLERKKLLETYKQEALALEGKSKAQIKAAQEAEKAQIKASKDAEIALKKEIALNEKSAKEARRVADAQTKAIMQAAQAHEKSQNRLIELEIKKEEAINRLNARKDASNEKSLQKEIDIANKRIQKELEAAEKIAQARRRSDARAGFALTPEQKAQQTVDKSSLAEVVKLNAVLTSQYTTALQKNDAQMRLNVIEMQKHFNPELKEQSVIFRNLAAENAKMQMQSDRLSRATGLMGRSMKGAYGSTVAFSQVMREMPNFAIDARLGFMALSNNLPMLGDEFKMMRQQIIDTEGAAGATMKTFKAFGKSLLSLNMILIVVSTLLVLFGDDIVEFATKLFTGEKAIDRTSESLKALIATTKDYNGQAAGTIQKIQELGLQVEKYGGETKHAQTLVENFNSTFNTHLTTIEQVKAAYPEMAKAAIDSAIKMQAAMSLIEKGSTAYLQIQEARMSLSSYNKKDVSAAYSQGTAIVSKAKELGFDETEMKRKIDAGEGFADMATKLRFAISGLSQAGEDFSEQRNLLAMINKFEKIQGANTIVKMTTQLGTAKKQFDYFTNQASTLIQPPTPNKTPTTEDKPIKREENRAVNELPTIDLNTFIKDTGSISPKMPDLGLNNETAFNQQLQAMNEQYRQGLMTYNDYLEKRKVMTDIAGQAGIKANIENHMEMEAIDKEYEDFLLERRADLAFQLLDIMSTLFDSIFEKQQELIDKQLDLDTKVNDEKLKQYEDETKAGIHSQEELTDFKERNAAYQQSLDEEAARKKEELEKKQFLMKQAFSLGEVWINYAVNATKYSWNPALVGWMLASAIASTALIAAQTIPAFKDGVDDFEGGKAILGDGYKHELAVSPKGMFISDNTPKLYDLDPHTTVFPDVNKVNLNSLLALRQVGVGGVEKRDDRLMRELIGAVKSQKQGNFYGMPLIRQMNMAETYSKRKRGLMN